jgi:hypothetical protein
MKRLFALLSLIAILAQSATLAICVGAVISLVTQSPGAGMITALSLTGIQLVLPAAPAGSLYITFTQGLCERVQTSLIELFGGNAPQLKRTPVGYLQALTSPQNTAGTQQVPVDPGNGKFRKVRIKFLQRGTSSDITTNPPTGCATELEKEPFEHEQYITKYIGTKGLKFTEDEMRKLCEPDSDFMAAVVNGEMNALAIELDKALIAVQATHFGEFVPYQSIGYKEVPLLVNATVAGQVGSNYYGESLIKEDIAALESGARPLVIGQGALAHYANLAKIGCCNDLGQDLSQSGEMDFFRDKHVPEALGTDHFIALIPGYVQLLTWNKYVGTYRKENDKFSKSTIVDPYTGITFDMKWVYNDCDEYYFLQIGLWYDIYFLPANAFATGDSLHGVNFSLHYKATTIGPAA